jgi:hypothetical protein
MGISAARGGEGKAGVALFPFIFILVFKKTGRDRALLPVVRWIIEGTSFFLNRQSRKRRRP